MTSLLLMFNSHNLLSYFGNPLCGRHIRIADQECGREFAFRHPTAALVSCAVSSFAGSLLCYPLLGENSRADFAFVCRDSI